MLSYEQAIAKLADTTAKPDFSIEDLRSIAKEIWVTPHAKYLSVWDSAQFTLFYGGSIQGNSTAKIVDDLLEKKSPLKAIDMTDVGEFLKSREFETAIEKLKSRPGADIGAINNALYGNPKTSIWAEASHRFAANTTGPVRFLAGITTSGERIFAETELPELLKRGNVVTHIEGIPVGEPNKLGADDDELSGNEGADTLDGDAGADRLLGGAGDDVMYGDNVGKHHAIANALVQADCASLHTLAAQRSPIKLRAVYAYPSSAKEIRQPARVH